MEQEPASVITIKEFAPKFCFRLIPVEKEDPGIPTINIDHTNAAASKSDNMRP